MTKRYYKETLEHHLLIALDDGCLTLKQLKKRVLLQGYKTKCQSRNWHGAIRKVIAINPRLFCRLNTGIYGLVKQYGNSRKPMPDYPQTNHFSR